MKCEETNIVPLKTIFFPHHFMRLGDKATQKD